MRRWWVITPEYGEVIPITDDGQGPTEYQSDAIEIEADTRRDAIVIGVAIMRANTSVYHWFRHCDGNPFVGIRAEETPVPCDTCEGVGGTLNMETGDIAIACSACSGTGIKK